MLKLGRLGEELELWNVGVAELGEVSFGMLKLGEVGL